MSFNASLVDSLPSFTDNDLFNFGELNTSYLVTGGLAAAFTVIQYLNARKRDINVPAVGPSGRLTSYIGAISFLKSSAAMLSEGYEKYKTKTFKVPELGNWLVIVNTPELIEEVRRAPDDKLSFLEAVSDGLAADFTLGRLVTRNQYHIPIVRSQLTRNIGVLFSDITEEIEAGFTEYVGTSKDWVSVPALGTMMKVVCMASNKVFSGPSICRNKEYMDLNIRFTIDVIKAASVIKMFPNFMKPLIGELLTSVPTTTRRAEKHLKPIIEQRLRSIEENGPDYPDKPNDMLSWLLEIAEGEQRTSYALTQRLLTLNFAAIHTSSMSFTHALLHLAANPQYIQLMREEVDRIIAAEGWTKASMQKMRRVDSFLRESQRYNGIGTLSMTRKVMVDYTLSDGTFLPKGSLISCNAYATHRLEENYDDANEFKPFRFSDQREESTEEGLKHQMVSTSNDYLPFGHGRHACPGRFFAANELKAMMAYIVANYDVKLPDEANGVRPADFTFGSATTPNQKAHVLFRRRQN